MESLESIRRINRPRMHAAQREVFESRARFRVVCAGRRWGKTLLGAWLCVECGMAGGRAWWVAPHYPIAEIGWRMIKWLAARVPGVTLRESDRSLTFEKTGGRIQVKSASDPDSLRGEGLDLVVIDEAAYVKAQAWTEALRPALSDRRGRAVFISTPAGLNWFWGLYQRGLDPAQADWQTWRFPSGANPYLAASEIASARELMPADLHAQEYEATFIEDANGTLRGVAEIATAEALSGPLKDDEYVMGVDLARLRDSTAISIFSTRRNTEVYLDRFNQVAWALQVQRIQSAAERFGVQKIVIDQTGLGDVVVEQLRREISRRGGALPVIGLTLTANTKRDVIESLALAIERREITLLNDPLALAEAQAYARERLPTGRFRYNSPISDDTVIARGLAWWGCQRRESAQAEAVANPFFG